MYLPPGDNYAFYTYLDKLNEIITDNSGDKIIICGDFNLPNIQWKRSNNQFALLPTDYPNSDARSVRFVDTVSFNNLAQYNSQMNQNNRVRDLILSNFIDLKV